MTAKPRQSELTSSPRTRPFGAGVMCVAAIWLMLVLGGMMGLSRSANQAAPLSQTVEVWPADSSLSGPLGRPCLVLFLHAKCGCSVATVRQLATLLSKCSNDSAVTAVFYCPDNKSTDWVRSGLWERCLRIPGTTCVVDHGGAEASRFGVLASGHVLLFDGLGQRKFDGGITTSRAHEGHGYAAEALRKLLAKEQSKPVSFPVFGCPIDDGQSENTLVL